VQGVGYNPYYKTGWCPLCMHMCCVPYTVNLSCKHTSDLLVAYGGMQGEFAVCILLFTFLISGYTTAG
jgi:hypothetical protein